HIIFLLANVFFESGGLRVVAYRSSPRATGVGVFGSCVLGSDFPAGFVFAARIKMLSGTFERAES
ncbi:MAG: hypothetical protein KGJ07_09215, partial [Patescibacteria group bacterium]|nr:hypothetical protein [Patescibacteria group bacterium]